MFAWNFKKKNQFLTSLENQTSQRLLHSFLAFPIVSASSPQNTLQDHSTKQKCYKKNIP